MIGTLRKHQTWLWGIIIVATIVSFVIYFTPSARVGVGGRYTGGNFGTIHGRPISRKQYIEAYTEAQLAIFLRNRVWVDRSDAERYGISLERETRNRLVLLDTLKRFNVVVPEAAVAQWIVDNFTDARRPGTTTAAYENFLRSQLAPHGISELDFEEFVRHQVGIMHMVAVAGTTGRLVTPREATELFRQEQEKVEAEAAIFSASNYLASVRLDPLALAQYYTNNRSLYRVPERVQLYYADFARTNYLAQARDLLAAETNLSARIDQMYLSENPSSFTDTNGQVLSPDAAKQKIRADLLKAQSLILAHRAAASFATNFESMKPARADNLVSLAAKLNVPCSTTEPFSENDEPVNLRLGKNATEFNTIAFHLTPEDPIALSPVVGEDSVYLFALKQKFPSELPSLDSIRIRVTDDFMNEQATRLARAAGTNFVAALTNALTQGKTFADACAAAKITPVALPPFAMATRTVAGLDPRLNLDQLKRAVSGRPAGSATGLLPMADGAFVLFVKARVPVTDAEVKAGLPKFLADLRDSEQYRAFDAWFRQQFQLSRIDIRGKDEGPQTAAQ
jgi:hypothetical protein